MEKYNMKMNYSYLLFIYGEKNLEISLFLNIFFNPKKKRTKPGIYSTLVLFIRMKGITKYLLSEI